MKMLSLAELMDTAFNLSLDLAYETLAPGGSYLHPRKKFPDGADIDLIFGWADGLTHAMYHRITSGRCSIQTQIDFDIAKFEESVERDIKTMQSLSLQLGPPRCLTYDEMQMLGYRGRWAGIFPLLTYPGIKPYSAI